MSPSPCIRFANCELDLDAFELRRDGRACAVEPQVFELLAYLVRNAGRLVTKDELIAHVWGGRIVSDAALASRLKSARKAIGDDGEQQRFIRTVHGRGVRFVAELATGEPARPAAAPVVAAEPAPASPPQQEIRFCTTGDGVRLAYGSVGDGPPLVKAANWLNHLEYDWESPVWAHLLHALAGDFRLTRYDERGTGLSDRDVADLSFDSFVRDLETVVDAAGLERFALFGVSQGCAVCVAYAVKHPERVSHLVLYGGYARGTSWDAPEEVARRDAMDSLIRSGWGQDNPAFRQLFTSRFIPDATLEQMRWFNELQRVSAAPETAFRLRKTFSTIDVRDLLTQVRAPTLVLHCRDDAAVSFERGRELASGIPGARFVPLDGRNHLVLENEPAFPLFMAEMRAFLGSTVATPVRIATARTAQPAPSSASAPAALGRGAETRRLRAALSAALVGRRQTLFVTGDAGVGKTTLIDAFARTVQTEFNLRVAQGQCLEHRGVGEAYMPVLEALGRLCQGADGASLVALLRERAPSWLVQMPWLVSPGEQEALQRRAAGNARERMLREIVEALEAASAETPLLLILEDLQWSDPSTVDLVARLAQRRETARLLVIGTYRPAELLTGDHPLRNAVQELRLRGLADELAVPLLTQPAVAEYLAARFPDNDLPSGFAKLLYQRTEGNPLFIGNVLGAWLARRLLVERDGRWVVDAPLATLATGVPDSLRQLVEQNLDRLDPESRALLETGSVVGREFTAATVAAGLDGAEEEDVDIAAAALARQGVFLHDSAGEDGPEGGGPRYGFRHDLYRQVLYDRIPPSRRRRLHQRIGTALEQSYAARASEHAAELATHFRLGRDAVRAINYGRMAAERALRRGAHGEALAVLTASLGTLRRLDDEAQRRDLEFGLQIGRAAAAIAAQGYAADEAEQAFRRAWELSAAPAPDRRYFQAGYGLFVVRWNRAWLVEAAWLAQELAETADAADDGVALCVSHRAVAVASNAIGDFARARDHAILALRSYDPERDRDSAAEFVHHIGVAALLHRAIADWHLGRADESAAAAETAIELARRIGHANSLAYALFFGAYLQLLARQGDAATALAAELVAFADERFMEYWAATGRCALGAASVISGSYEAGHSRLRDGLDRLKAAQIAIFRPTFLGFLAEAENGLGRRELAAEFLKGALELVRTTQERWFEPELRRLQRDIAAM